ncbi:hypothetical protein [Pseudomonas mosselii]|uniref:Peptidase S8/S53 domain-containing protein n=1 Tax=Pseudomonas mosselii TaxID=78327 RepID=A0AA42S0D5_9PSED|nr:hypothetical protein [Pseudomonas mosselii]MDH1632463.1 hypothetical protein [Pseudomonas mosselii]
MYLPSFVSSSVAVPVARFFAWLKQHHRQVVVINSAGNNAARTDDHLPAALVSEQLLVIGAHQRSGRAVPLTDVDFAVPRRSSNTGPRVDISAAACLRPVSASAGDLASGCGTGNGNGGGYAGHQS